jgi:pyruvate kinase
MTEAPEAKRQKTNGFGHCSRRTSMEDDESILEKMDDIPSCQEKAREQATHVEFVSNLNMYSTANKMRLSGIVCTIGPVSREPATLLELIENGMNVARMNFSHGSHEYHAQTMENCRTAAKMYKEKHGVDPNLAIALDTKGPEIRTGLLEGVSTRYAYLNCSLFCISTRKAL